jgi:hypothetical protein
MAGSADGIHDTHAEETREGKDDRDSEETIELNGRI